MATSTAPRTDLAKVSMIAPGEPSRSGSSATILSSCQGYPVSSPSVARRDGFVRESTWPRLGDGGVAAVGQRGSSSNILSQCQGQPVSTPAVGRRDCFPRESTGPLMVHRDGSKRTVPSALGTTRMSLGCAEKVLAARVKQGAWMPATPAVESRALLGQPQMAWPPSPTASFLAAGARTPVLGGGAPPPVVARPHRDAAGKAKAQAAAQLGLASGSQHLPLGVRVGLLQGKIRAQAAQVAAAQKDANAAIVRSRTGSRSSIVATEVRTSPARIVQTKHISPIASPKSCRISCGRGRKGVEVAIPADVAPDATAAQKPATWAPLALPLPSSPSKSLYSQSTSLSTGLPSPASTRVSEPGAWKEKGSSNDGKSLPEEEDCEATRDLLPSLSSSSSCADAAEGTVAAARGSEGSGSIAEVVALGSEGSGADEVAEECSGSARSDPPAGAAASDVEDAPEKCDADRSGQPRIEAKVKTTGCLPTMSTLSGDLPVFLSEGAMGSEPVGGEAFDTCLESRSWQLRNLHPKRQEPRSCEASPRASQRTLRFRSATPPRLRKDKSLCLEVGLERLNAELEELQGLSESVYTSGDAEEEGAEVLSDEDEEFLEAEALSDGETAAITERAHHLSQRLEDLLADALQCGCDRDVPGAMDVFQQASASMDVLAEVIHESRSASKVASTSRGASRSASKEPGALSRSNSRSGAAANASRSASKPPSRSASKSPSRSASASKSAAKYRSEESGYADVPPEAAAAAGSILPVAGADSKSGCFWALMRMGR